MTIKMLAVCFAFVFFFTEETNATHFRYGNVTWSYESGNTVTFHITQAWRRSFAWNTPPLVGGLPVFTGNFFFGDSTQAPMNVNVTAVNITENWFYGEATITHTYSGPGPWTAFFGSCCRISTLQNNFDGNYRVETTVDFAGGNNSPISTLQPIVNLSTGLPAATFIIPASDPDKDIITFTLSSPVQMGDTTLTQPPGLAIDAATGVVTWSTVGRTVGEMWNASVRVSDGRGGIVTLDFLIKIVALSGPPYFNYVLTPVSGFVYNVEPGIPLVFTVEALDDDVGDTVTLQAFGLPVGAAMIPGLPLDGNPVQSVFSWTPAQAQLGSRIVSFMAQDLSGNQTSTFVTINVSMNPVFDYPPTPPDSSGFCIASGVTYSATVQAHAPDAQMNLQISSANIPAGATLTPSVPTLFANISSTVLDWTPAISDWGGPHELTFTATDALGHSTTTSFSLVVNTPVVFTSSPPVLTISENQLFVYNITLFDPDVPYGDELEIMGITIPSWLTLTDNGDGTGTLSGTPGAANIGNNPVQIDGEDIHHHCFGQVSQLFDITVTAPCTLRAFITPKPAVVSSYCAGQRVELTAFGGTGYLWNTGETDQRITVIANGIVTYSVTVTNGNCSATASYTIVASANVPPLALCRNVVVYLDAAGNGTITAADVDRGSRDNCSSITRSVSPSSFNCSHIGNISVILTVTDTSGLSSVCNALVAVIDSTHPVAYCKDASVQLDASGNAVISVADIDNGSTDNCAITPSVYPSSFNCSSIGANTVTLTITGTGGLSSSCSATVTVAGSSTPLALCKDKTVFLDTSGNALITAADVDAGSTGNCGSLLMTVSPSFLTCANLGVNTVTLTVTNALGISSSCNALVTAIDNIPPVAQCRNATVTLDAAGLATITAAAIDNGSSDNCFIAAQTVSPSSFNCSNIGANTVTLTVTGAGGFTSSCNAIVTVSGIISSCSASSLPGTVYLGYGVQSAILSVNVTGALSYAWTPATGLSCAVCASPVFTPVAEGNYTFTVTVTNATGCVSLCNVTVCVLDVRVPATEGQKIYVCHVLPVSQGGSNTLALSINAVSAHYPLHIDDRLGRCDQRCGGAFKTDEEGTTDLSREDSDMLLYPNPFINRFQIGIESQSTEPVYVRVFDLAGKLIADYPARHATDGLLFGARLAKGVYLVEVRQGSYTKVVRMVKAE